MKRKRIINITIIFFITMFVFLGSMEVTYRFQWFDFYKAELTGLNSENTLGSKKRKGLIIGDSFSASTESYVNVLRDSLTSLDIINASVPGTGILQHVLYGNKRIKKYAPVLFIYQFYVGNDLFDISHPWRSSHISYSRKAYWWLSDRLLSIAYLNFRFAGIRYQFSKDEIGNYKPKENDVFSLDAYSKREKLNYLAETGLIENTLYLEGGRLDDWNIFKTKFKEMISYLPADGKKIFLIIPHQSQLSHFYLNRHQQIGAQFKNPIDEAQGMDYPLYKKIQALCKETGFKMVDPLQVFRAADLQAPLYYSNDPHLNNYGHKILGQLLIKEIQIND